MKKDERDYYRSYDLGLVAYLLCEGYELVEMDNSMKNKTCFVMERDERLDGRVKRFWDCNTSVDAQTYFNHMKRLKNQIYSS